MKRNKKLLVSFLALNAILASHAEGASASAAPVKYERMYNSIVKNIEKGNSSEKTYQTIERILNQKNKELKDLYLQGDYIVKPEYLEWQVFFTGFYEEYNEGVDNSKENAVYHSKVTGYYDVNGNYVTTGGGISGMSGKPYQPLQQPKDINLGVSIPLKGMTKDVLNLNLSPVNEINVNPNVISVTPPSGISIPQVNPIEFQPISPSIPTVAAPSPVSISLAFPGSGNGDSQWITQNGSVAPIAQQKLVGQASGGTLDAVSTSTAAAQRFDLSIHDTQATGYTGTGHTATNNGIQNFDWTNQTSTHAVMKLVGSHPIDIENMTMNFIGVGNKPSAYLMLFHTDAHNFNTEDSLWILDADTKINMSGQKIILYGVQSHSSYTTGSGMINNGTVIADASTTATTSQGTTYTGLTPYQRVIFTTINDDTAGMARYNRYFYFTNTATGSITTNGTGDILANYATPGNGANGGTVFTNDGTH